MRKKLRRVFCLLLAALTLVSLKPQPTDAATPVYFTAVNDQLLPLSDETMPFWSGGMLYVAYTVFSNTDLGTFYSRSRDKTTAVLYRQRSGALMCDFTAGTIYDNSSKQVLGGAPLTRGDVVFLPVDTVCRFFGFDYSYTRISYGYLVRVKNEAVVLSDATFIDAASAPMTQRYNRYERSKQPEEPVTTDEPAAPTAPAAPAAPTTPTTPAEPVERTVYLAVESTSPARTEQVLNYLSVSRVMLLFAPQALSGADDLLRRLAANGGSVALRIDASGGAEAALAQLREGNRALWAAANVKTRFVYPDGADEETVRALSEAGYCPLRFSQNFSGSLPSVSRLTARIYAAADANRGSCRVLLGTDGAVAGSLNALLTAFRTGNCTPARLAEALV